MERYLLWDYNGTIIDDLDLCVSIENRMLKERNLPSYPVSREEYQEHFCFPVINYYYKVGYTFEDETYEEVSNEFNKEYQERFFEVSLMEEFIPTIEKAISLGYHNVILSASYQKNLDAQCDALNICNYFESIIGIDDQLASSKIEHAKRWMNQAQVKPEQCKYLGDSLHDLETARELGVIDCVLIAKGHQSYGVLSKEYSNVVHSLDEVIL